MGTNESSYCKVLLVTSILLATLCIEEYFYFTGDEEAPPCTSCYPMADCGQPFEQLKLETAKTLISNYRKNHFAFLTGLSTDNPVSSSSPKCPSLQPPCINKEDSRCVWYSLEKIKRFIYEIEAKTCENNQDSKLNLGVRLYFAENPTTPEDCTAHGIPAEYAGLHTLVMIPTYDDPASTSQTPTHIDFDPAYKNGSAYPVPLYQMPAATTMITALDHGGVTPPPFPPAEQMQPETFGLGMLRMCQ